MVYMIMGQLLKGEYRLGKPWKLPEAAGFLVPIHMDPPYKDRDYILLKEANSKVDFRDTGSINIVEVKNESGYNVFIRKGTMLHGEGTQSRSPIHGIIIEPIKKYIPMTVNCIHASHSISSGSGFKASGVAPQSVTQNLGEQSNTWASIDRYTSKLKRAYRAAAPRNEVEHLMEIAEDNLVETENAAKNAVDPISEALSKIPGDHLDQIGVVVFDLQGVVAVELFNHPESWKAFSKSIIRSYGETLTEKISDLIEIRTDKAEQVFKTFLKKAKTAQTNLLTENSVSKIWNLQGKEINGEVAELKGTEIHLSLNRQEKKETINRGEVQYQTQQILRPIIQEEAAPQEEEEINQYMQKKGGYSLLEQLARTPQRFSDLVQERFVSRGTLSTRIKEAEELGLVEKNIRKSNGTPAYTLTETGEKIKEKTEKKAK